MFYFLCELTVDMTREIALMIKFRRVLGGVGHIPTTYIQLAGAGSKKNNAKFIDHYVCPRTHNVRAHAIRSHQKISSDRHLTLNVISMCTHK